MAKRRQGQHRNTYDVTLPDTLHDMIINDMGSMLSRDDHLGCQTDVHSPVLFKTHWLRENLLSKFLDGSVTKPSERKTAAIEKWLLMEDRNRTTNMRLRFMEADFGPFTSERVFETAGHFIQRMIGSSPSESVLNGQFTNGASTRVKRGSTAIAQKYTGKLHCSSSAMQHFERYLHSGEAEAWKASFDSGICTLESRESSVMFTVPKSSQIDRVACKEPEINMFLQRGVGDYFRAKLKQQGVNLNDQTRNRGLARRGSLPGTNLATLDLSSASDLISTSLVYRLLPLEWVLYLEDIRVKYTEVPGIGLHELEMFSSMGNGFTFELESLLFFSLAKAVTYLTGTRGIVSVYGDDIIIPSSVVGLFTKVLQFMGCKVNLTKSFWTGGFRESCGGHYYYGNDVTPFYIRERIVNLPGLILFLNQLRKWATNTEVGLQYFSLDPYRIWDKYRKFVPTSLWGGREVEANDSLVTPHMPRKRLANVQRVRRASQHGALLYWLHRRTDSDVYIPGFDQDVGIVTSYGSFDGDFVLRRNRSWDTGLSFDNSWESEY